MKKSITYLDNYGHTPKRKYDLSLSENPIGQPEYVKEVLVEFFGGKSIHEYPRGIDGKFATAVAKKFNIDKTKLFFGHGSCGILETIAFALIGEGDTCITPELTFDFMEIPVALRNGNIVNSKMTADFQIDIDDIKSKITDNTKLVFFANPNNPTGKTHNVKDILSIAKHLKEGFLIVDEANIEFNPACESAFNYIKEYDNVIITRTLSKAHGLAGARLGYAFANYNIIKRASHLTQAYDVNSFAFALGIRAMGSEGEAHIKKTNEFIAKNKAIYEAELEKINVKYLKSDIHTLCVKRPNMFTNNEDFAFELAKKDISIVHQYTNFDYIRTVIKDEETVRYLVKSIDEVTKEFKDKE